MSKEKFNLSIIRDTFGLLIFLLIGVWIIFTGLLIEDTIVSPLLDFHKTMCEVANQIK